MGFVIYNGQSDANVLTRTLIEPRLSPALRPRLTRALDRCRGQVPYNGQVQYWAANYSVLHEYEPWYRRGPRAAAAGHVRTYQTPTKSKLFTFVTVSGAGHEVPTYRPAAALTMLEKFVLK